MMGAMTAMPYDREWTVDDLDALPDDGLRHELVDGVLLVSPAPVPLHQSAVWRLLELLNSAAPPGTRALPSPIGYRISVTREVQPDVVVIWDEEIARERLTRPLLLAVEVLSPGSVATDTTLKLHVYEQAGVPSYWIVDPREPAVTVLELVDGRYAEAALVRGDEVFEAHRPFPVRVVPAGLVR